MDATITKVKIKVEDALNLKKWIENKKDMLIVTGKPGTGKTYLAAAIVNFWYETFPSFRVWKEREFLAKIRDAIDQTKGDYQDQIQLMADDYFLILDDFGSCGFTDWRLEVWHALVDYRYSEQLPTIIISNLTRKEIDEKFHPRFSSRLFSKENTVIEMNGFDYRSQSND